MNISTREEVERCLPHFIRLCVWRSINDQIGIDASAVEIARSFHGRFPSTMPPELRDHFTVALCDLVELASALAPRISLPMLKDFVERASLEQVSTLLERSLAKTLRTEA